MNKRLIIGRVGAGCMSMFLFLVLVFVLCISIWLIGTWMISWIVV